MGGFLAQTTDTGITTPQIIGGTIGLLISIFLAYKCAANRRWILFILGFFCGILWIVGWALGPKDRGFRS